MVHIFYCPLGTESAIWALDEVFVVEIFPCKDIISKDAYLKISCMRNSAGSVYLTYDFLRFVGSIVHTKLSCHFCAILHVFPVIYIELCHFSIHLPEMCTTLLVDLEQGVFHGEAEGEGEGDGALSLVADIYEVLQLPLDLLVQNKVESCS